MTAKKYHPFHLVDPSPWPFFTALTILYVTVGGVMYMHAYQSGLGLLSIGFFLLILISMSWWRDVVREGTYEGRHTKEVERGLALGMVLFIVSEIMFFFAFFWAYFHVSLSPAVEIGSSWPPAGITVLSPWKIPLLNTAILLLSGVTLTAAHYNLVLGESRFNVTVYLISTILLGTVFTLFQVYEYIEAPFSIHDGIYGSVFFLLTGFHGFHVLVGTIFIIVGFVRFFFHHFTREHHLGFEASAWYWHFVDVVWLFLFIFVYCWGAGSSLFN
jgi:cytochrome c oxidase subunit 3